MPTKTYNLENDVISRLEQEPTGTWSHVVNEALRLYFKDKPNPIQNKEEFPLPHFSPRNACAYVRERLNTLRSVQPARLCDLISMEVGLSEKKTLQFVKILTNLGFAVETTDKYGKIYIVSLWQPSNNKYITKEEYNEIKKDLTIEEEKILTAGLDG